MRIRWWQSIRWRLSISSLVVTLLATSLLLLVALLSLLYYYGGNQKDAIRDLALDRATHITQAYAALNPPRLIDRATAAVFPSQSSSDSLYLVVVQDRRGRVLYPAKIPTGTTIAHFLATMADPTVQNQQYDTLHVRADIVKGFHGVSTVDNIGKSFIVQPFAVQPIFSSPSPEKGRHVIGVVIVTPLSVANRTIPPFIQTVGGAVLLASPLVALIVALVALLFSRTITGPLARLTRATHVLASGDYDARVETNAKGELGELAHNFNNMASQLKLDVAELHKQELWRRELIMSITHDLATPLTAIAGLGESLVDGVNQDRDDYEATGRIIVRETLRLRRLVQDLHMMGKMEARALDPQLKPVRLAALVDEVLAVLAPEFEKGHVEPCNAVPYTLPTVQADPDMLTRVFSNLCDNALQHTPPKGTVTIEARQIHDMLAVAVTDTGPGIPSESLARVFERFFRADTSRQSTKGGSGLGLAIVKAIVEAHGGQVWAENAREGGARFIFTLPLQPSTGPAHSEDQTLPQFQRETQFPAGDIPLHAPSLPPS